MRKLAILVAAAAAMLAATPSSATKLLYKMTEIGGNGEQYSFVVDSHPTPIATNLLGALVGPVNITGTGPGVGNYNIYFGYISGLQIRSGLTALSGKVGALLGDDLTTGFGSSMTLNTGNFAVAGLSGRFNVNVAAVPETATWAMMILGFGVLGFAARARRSSGLALTA